MVNKKFYDWTDRHAKSLLISIGVILLVWLATHQLSDIQGKYEREQTLSSYYSIELTSRNSEIMEMEDAINRHRNNMDDYWFVTDRYASEFRVKQYAECVEELPERYESRCSKILLDFEDYFLNDCTDCGLGAGHFREFKLSRGDSS